MLKKITYISSAIALAAVLSVTPAAANQLGGPQETQIVQIDHSQSVDVSNGLYRALINA